MFFTQMPKGGDLHHHYSGAIYAETYVDFLDKQGYCVNKQTYKHRNRQGRRGGRARQAGQGAQLPGHRRRLRRRLHLPRAAAALVEQGFHNHGALQAPPDRQFFQTFGYFGPVSNANFHEGLVEIKEARDPRERRLHRDHVQDVALRREQGLRRPGLAERARRQGLRGPDARLDDPARPGPEVRQSIADFTAKIDEAAAGIDDERFTMRYQTYVLRLLNPSQVFSSMLAGFKAASRTARSSASTSSARKARWCRCATTRCT
jgi:adenosine deaminase